MTDETGDRDAIAAIRRVRERATDRREWPDDAKDKAYQLWAFVHGRDCVKVQADLAHAIGDDPGYDVPLRTIQHWALSDNWAIRAASDLAAIAPDVRRQAVIELIAGSLPSARYLRDVVEGRVKPDRVRLIAADMILSRVGLAPRQDGQLPTTATDTRATLAPPSTPEEARQRIDDLRRKYRKPSS